MSQQHDAPGPTLYTSASPELRAAIELIRIALGFVDDPAVAETPVARRRLRRYLLRHTEALGRALAEEMS